jgi:TRAP-type mannitol/chloroaromatic compound transport system permease small subunit
MTFQSCLSRLCDRIDRLNGGIGRTVAWAVLAMALIQLAVIVGRPLGVTSIWLRESLVYLHVLLVLFAAAWTLGCDGHVRVDIFYAEASPRWRAAIDLAGAVLLLIPFMLAVLWLCEPYVARAFAVREGSREAGGLPLVFLLKSTILVFAGQMLLQGISQGLRASMVLVAGPPPAVTPS